MKQKTISFNDDLFLKLDTECNKFNNSNNLTITFSQFVCSKLKEIMK